MSIVRANATAASVKNLLRTSSRSGGELLRRDGLPRIPDLHASSQVGVLVFSKPGASIARAHAAARAQYYEPKHWAPSSQQIS